jgi:hypothetical protein
MFNKEIIVHLLVYIIIIIKERLFSYVQNLLYYYWVLPAHFHRFRPVFLLFLDQTDSEGLARNHCYCVNAIGITYLSGMWLGRGNVFIQHAKRVSQYCVVICGVSGSTIFFDIILTARFLEKKVIEHKMCVLIFSTTFIWNISHSKKNSLRYYHKCTYVFTLSTSYSCQILIKL